MVKNKVKKYTSEDKNDLRLELALIAYRGIFSNPEMYKIAVDYHNKTMTSTSISQMISQMCFRATDEFIKKLNTYQD